MSKDKSTNEAPIIDADHDEETIDLEALLDEIVLPTFISSIENMPTSICDRLSRHGIDTIEELIEKCPSESSLPLSPLVKWRFLVLLDRQGYRLNDCSKEEWPDINEYIYMKRAENYTIEDLELPDELSDTLKEAGITVSKIVQEEWVFLQSYFTNYEIAIILCALKGKRLRVKNMSREQYPELSDFILEYIDIPISALGLSPRINNNLNQSDIKSLKQLAQMTRQQLIEQKIVGIAAMKELTMQLKFIGVHLTGDAFYTCYRCDCAFVAALEPGEKHYCPDCAEKLKRIKRIRDYEVTIDGPDYGTYTDGTAGFTLFATIHNKSKKIVEVKLKDFILYVGSRQWAPAKFLTGYFWDSEHIMPESSKTVAKIWSGYMWKDKRLSEGDYINFSLAIKEKTYAYKFVMKDSMFVLDDFFTY